MAATPTPTRLYIHDDLTDEVIAKYGGDSEEARLTQDLIATIQRNCEHVVLTREENEVSGVVDQGPWQPFDLALGVGGAGERVAQLLHAQLGIFPSIVTLDLTREENDTGGYNMVSKMGIPFTAQLPSEWQDFGSVAVVDDTIFSGLTMGTVLRALPAEVRQRTRVFCLRSVDVSLPTITPLAPVTSGLNATGAILTEVSIIKSSGLVRRGAIRRSGSTPLAYFERSEWMHAWFPNKGPEIIDRCRALNNLLAHHGDSHT